MLPMKKNSQYLEVNCSKLLQHVRYWSHVQNIISFHIIQASLVECYSNHIITRISIQTAGLPFGGIGLCSYRVRGVDGWQLCKAFNYRILYGHLCCQQSYLLLLVFHHPLIFSFQALKPKPPFSVNHSHCSLSFSSSGLTTWFPRLLLLLLSIFRLLLFSFSVFTPLAVFSVR